MGWAVSGVSSLPHVQHPPGRLLLCRHVPTGTPFAGTPATTPFASTSLFLNPSLPAPLSADTAPAGTQVQGHEGCAPPTYVWWGWGQLPSGWDCPGAHPQGKQLRALQPYVLSCCYSADGSVVAETFQVLRDLVDQLPWQHSAAFLIQLAFTLAPFLEEVRPPRPVSLLGHRLSSNGVARTVSEALGLDGDACEGADSHGPRSGDGPEGRGQSQWGRDDGGPADGGGLRATVWKAGLHCLPLTWVHVCVLPQESEHLRLTAFEIYGALLAKVSRRVFVFPLRHQVLNLLILLVLHLEDANGRIAQVRAHGAEGQVALAGCQ